MNTDNRRKKAATVILNAAEQSISDIFAGRTIYEARTAAEAFLDHLAAAPKYERRLCERFVDSMIRYCDNYVPLPFCLTHNVTVVPPEYSPVIMLSAYVPISNDPDCVVAGLKRFIDKCGEFREPLHEAITYEEINAVLDDAQKSYRLVDILAPKLPLKILLFNNSHAEHNSECGVPVDPERETAIFLYHPLETAHDRVFIFAHELGHALHLSLTRDAEVLPDSFDRFNEKLGIIFHSVHQKQEAFADVTAMAVLSGGLSGHLPHELSDAMLENFDMYIRYAIRKHLMDRSLI
ncbi:MAG: hypothetical protein LBK56_09205 [Gracilibacteraceae bacterium]|jgi:hypothetical protein|nr:hypothetical protein [Gracilibacteraceae bacterium]